MRALFTSISLLLMLSAGCAEHDGPFDSAAWKAASKSFDTRDRSAFVPALLRDHKLVGMSESELVDLLGPANVYPDKPSNQRWYLISEQYGTDIDPIHVRHLVLTLDGAGKVSGYEQVAHTR